MPWRIVTLAAGLVGAAALTWWNKDEISGFWDATVIRLKGKRIAVLGPRGAGKTTLLSFLSKGEIPSEYIQTLVTVKVESNRYSMGDLKLDLKETSDVSGSQDAIEEWRKIYDASDVVLYLVNAEKIDRQRIERDLEQIGLWQMGEHQPQLLVVVTHLDRDPVYQTIHGSKQGDYRDRFVAVNLDSGLHTLSKRPQIIMGSLKDPDSAAKVVAQIIGLVSL